MDCLAKISPLFAHVPPSRTVTMLKSMPARFGLFVAVASAAASAVFAQNREPGIRPRVAQTQPAAPALPAAPKAPFRLNEQQQQRIDQLLVVWEKKSDAVKLFKCKFTRWDYDHTFGPKAKGFLMSQRQGEIKFRAPDRGTFKETSIMLYDAEENKYIDSVDSKKKEVARQQLEHWVCDGKAVYQFDTRAKTLVITELPPEMRGKAITEGPLPFIFGAKADTLRQRYWIEETTPQAEVGKQIWLRAWPKFREQAADFKFVEVILGAEDMLPVGMQVYKPNGKDHNVYVFEDRKINDKFSDFFEGDFLPPMTPPFWKKVVHPANAPPAAQSPPQRPHNQAIRPSKTARQ
jgi:TIGR03009 family protein